MSLFEFIALTALASAMLLARGILLAFRRLFMSAPTSRVYQTDMGVREILTSMPAKEMRTARARANSRLRGLLRLTNAFVSEDANVHREFVSAMHKLIRPPTDWFSLRDIATLAVREALQGTESVPFDLFVGQVTLQTICSGLLQSLPMPSIDRRGHFRAAARGITRLCLASKAAAATHLDTTASRILHHDLRELLPDATRFPNPIDYILPPYETMWRVVATLIAYTYHDLDYRQVLYGLYEQPTSEQFIDHKIYLDKPRVSAQDMVRETLRVHPPTKRIGRVMADSSWIRYILGLTHDVLHRADVEAAQRKASVWGEVPGIWRPERFIQGKGGAHSSAQLLAFGYGPGACIAREWAPMAIGVIAGAILYALEELGMEYSIVRGPRVGDREGWEGWEVKKVA